MGIIVYTLAAIIGLFSLVAGVWRLASNRYALPCPAWLSWFVEMDNPCIKTYRAATIIDHLSVGWGMAVLDVGCGPGRLTIPLAKKVGDQGEVVALDIQSGMIRRAEEKAIAENLNNIHFIQAAIGNAKLQKNHFDQALLVTVLGEIPHKAEVLAAIYAALKPGGVLSVTEIIFDPHYQSRQSVTQSAISVGFQVNAFFGNRMAYTLNFIKPISVTKSFN